MVALLAVSGNWYVRPRSLPVLGFLYLKMSKIKNKATLVIIITVILIFTIGQIVSFIDSSPNLSNTTQNIESISSSSPNDEITDISIQDNLLDDKTIRSIEKKLVSNDKFYPVKYIVDGDTVKIEIMGKIETLRLIGMDTPETVDPRKPVQCFGMEASNQAKSLLLGRKVRIEVDPTQSEKDIYGRILAYIYRDDGLFYNKYMIEHGYAYEYTYDSVPYKYQSEFKESEVLARSSQLGLWSPETCNGTASSIQQTGESNVLGGKYYTSSHYSAKYYYTESCSEWKNLSSTYLKIFDSLEDLLSKYDRVLSPQCN